MPANEITYFGDPDPISKWNAWESDRYDRHPREDATPDLPLCGCENSTCSHDYRAVPAGEKVARYVGAICDDCATDCIPFYVLDSQTYIDERPWQE